LTSKVGKNLKKKYPLVTSIPLKYFFCVQQKKETHTGLEQLEGT